MHWLIAIGLTFTLAAGAARAATPAQIACASYKAALDGETDPAKRAVALRSLPLGCTVPSPQKDLARKRKSSPSSPPTNIAPEDGAPDIEDLVSEGLGDLHSKDYAGALSQFQAAADRGDEGAEAMLGVIYDLGHGGAANPGAVRAWMVSAAAAGNSEAKDWLAQHPQ
jgi:TPR repeat protein